MNPHREGVRQRLIDSVAKSMEEELYRYSGEHFEPYVLQRLAYVAVTKCRDEVQVVEQVFDLNERDRDTEEE